MTFFVLRGSGNAFLSTTDGTGTGGGIGAGSAPRPVDAILASLNGMVTDVERLIAGKSRDTLTQPDNDGGWGVVDILSHLLDWQKVTESRVHRLLTEDNPHLEEFDDSLWAVEHHYRENDPQQVLATLRQRREALVAELARLTPEAWDRTGSLDRSGTITLHWLVNKVCDHDAKHVQQVRDVLA